MSIFQLGALTFALLMLYVVSIHQKRRLLSTFESSVWYSLWTFFIIIAMFPDLLLGITGVLRFARVFDLLVVLAFMVLTILVFATYFTVKEMKTKLETVVRETAITRAKKK